MAQGWDYEGSDVGRRAYPVAVAEVRNPDRRNPRKAQAPIKCLVDSGADRSAMPVPFLKRLGVTSGWEEDIKDFSGETKTIEASHVRISLCGRKHQLVAVVRLEKGALGILGRDVLNDFRVVLAPQKGQRGRCEIE